MARHDYHKETIAIISNSMENCKNIIENYSFSTENMPYSWNAGLIHNVVTLFEVMEVNSIRVKLQSFFETSDQNLSSAIQRVSELDQTVSISLQETLDSLNKILNKMFELETALSEYSQVEETHIWMNNKEARIYGLEEYIRFDKSRNKYVLKDRLMLNELLEKDILTPEEEKMLIRIMELSVDSVGNINMDYLSDILESGYHKKKKITNVHQEEHVSISSYYHYWEYSYEYYAVYTKSKHFDKILSGLNDEKFSAVKLIIESCSDFYETEHVTLEIDFDLDPGKNEQDLLNYTREKTENTFGQLEFVINIQDITNSINDDEYQKISVNAVEYTVHPNEKKRNKYEAEWHSVGKFNVYTSIDNVGTEELVLKEEYALDIQIRKIQTG